MALIGLRTASREGRIALRNQYLFNQPNRRKWCKQPAPLLFGFQGGEIRFQLVFNYLVSLLF